MARIFHYTSNEGAIRIIQSQCLHATHFEFLNDSQELMMSRGIIQPIIAKLMKERYTHLVDIQAFEAGIEDKYGSDVFEKEAEKLVGKAINVGTKLATPFLLSFCRHVSGDQEWQHGLLSQWRGYGSNGGCALEFEEEALGDLLTKENSLFSYGSIAKGNAVYDNHYDELDESQIVSIVNDVLDRIADIKDAHEPPNLDYLHDVIFGIGSMFKHNAFREEEEVRVTACPVRDVVEALGYGKPRKSIEMRYRSGMPIPYIKLFDFKSPLPITRVLVGPQRDQEKVAKALKFAFDEQNISVHVDISGISYLP